MEDLSGDYIAGFVDGEGCFVLKFRRDIRYERKSKPIYFYWDAEFVIVLRADDKGILEQIQKTLGCGRISFDKRGSVRFSVSNLDDLKGKIIPFFEKHHLHTKKRFDFLLWKKSVGLLYKNRGLRTNISATSNERGARKKFWDPLDLKKLEEICKEMAKYKGGHRIWKWLNR